VVGGGVVVLMRGLSHVRPGSNLTPCPTTGAEFEDYFNALLYLVLIEPDTKRSASQQFTDCETRSCAQQKCKKKERSNRSRFGALGVISKFKLVEN
jgi:hypothetical protein